MFNGDSKIPIECPTFQWETRLDGFPTWAVAPRIGIFLSSLKISNRLFLSLLPGKKMPTSLVAHAEMPKTKRQKKKKKKSTKPTNFVTKIFLLFQLRPWYHMMCLFTNKEVTSLETRRHPIIIWNVVTWTWRVSCVVYRYVACKLSRI